MADAGKAMMLYKKAYNSKYTYEKLDVVSYNGSLYISTEDGNLGNAPTDETKWQLFLQGGIADNIQATDTHGLVGTAGASSFVQLLLDALAANTVKKSNILNTMEEIEANTSAENISGALAINALKINFANSLTELNSNLGVLKVVEHGSISSGALTFVFSSTGGGIYLLFASSQWDSVAFLLFYGGATQTVTATNLKTGETVRNVDANSTFTAIDNITAYVVYILIKIS